MARIKQPQKTKEELMQESLECDLKDKQKKIEFIGEPTYYFNVGDEVVIGNLENVIVSKIYNDGKIYEITYSSTNNNYGNPIITHGNRMIVNWTDIRKPTNNQESFIKNKDVRFNYSNTQLTDILSKSYYFGVNFDPEYQREYVWELEDKISLIDSIFNNIDIGKFVFIRKEYADKYLYEILDGKQRVRAILDFFEDRFKYNEKLFSELSYQDSDILNIIVLMLQ